MPLLETKGAASAQGFGLTTRTGPPPVYIEDVFSTWLYTGNGSTQAASTGINLSTKGGLVWTKRRNGAASHFLVDTVRGNNKPLSSNSTAAQTVAGVDYITPTTTGYTVENVGNINTTGETYASWTFAKQPKFFDVVTYTGTSSVQNISHNLGSVPGCIIVKSMTDAVNWNVYHRSVGSGSRLILNDTTGAVSAATTWNNTDPTSTQFTVGTSSQINFSGSQYVAYLFAHNAGGFGLTGTDNVISCGSFTTDGSGNAAVSLGYEPQWVLIKQTDGVDSWYLNDNMRGMAVSGNQPNLSPNSSAAESAGGYNTYPNATGFTASVGIASKNYIYIAIRRGPMKTPTTGTSVFAPQATRAATTANDPSTNAFTSNFPVDMFMQGYRAGNAVNAWTQDRLRGDNRLSTSATGAETSATAFKLDDMDGIYSGLTLSASSDHCAWQFRRAPGFFDVVCNNISFYAVSGNHNLGVVPQMIIGKRRDSTSDWFVYHIGLTGVNSQGKPNQQILLNSTAALTTATGNGYYVDLTATTYDTFWWPSTSGTAVLYFFASAPGVSKVGSYTGTGALQTIDCGFTGGARFVLIKRTDSTGDWYVYDSARGITSGNDPYLFLNSTAAEVTGTNYVDTTSVGFQVTAAAPAGLNANGGTYIYLAIA